MDYINISIIGVSVLITCAILNHFIPFFLWISALVSGVRISFIQLILMRIRNVPAKTIVPSLIEAHQAGLSGVTRQLLEAHHMSGGNVKNVVHALVSATKAKFDLSFEQASAIDLAGRDILDAVKTSVIPKVINTQPVEAVAKDGIQVIVKARITVRSDMNKLVGGAGEDTILARVGECIVTSIGSSNTHKEVMENPDNISKMVLERQLDHGTAFEILSVDIADVDLGKNVGAQLQIEKANADKSIAQAKAEERRSMAVALEQEMRANKIQAESEVPKALAKALESGNLGYIDYYKIKNIQSDSAMRESFSKTEKKASPVINVTKPNGDFF